jgi:hypothetical protein
VVQNAKATNGRALGKIRTLDLQGMSPRDLAIVFFFSAHMREKAEQGEFPHIQKMCTNLLRSINIALWPHRKGSYTIYSARHQLSANAKSMYDRETVAALMGHASIKTAKRHYGRASAADGGKAGGGPRAAVPVPTAETRDAVLAKIAEAETRRQTREMLSSFFNTDRGLQGAAVRDEMEHDRAVGTDGEPGSSR